MPCFQAGQLGPSQLLNITLIAFLQLKLLDPDGVLEEALVMFKKTEEGGH
jgi:hypothetical protein